MRWSDFIHGLFLFRLGGERNQGFVARKRRGRGGVGTRPVRAVAARRQDAQTAVGPDRLVGGGAGPFEPVGAGGVAPGDGVGGGGAGPGWASSHADVERVGVGEKFMYIIRTIIIRIAARGAGWSGCRCARAHRRRECHRHPRRLQVQPVGLHEGQGVVQANPADVCSVGVTRVPAARSTRGLPLVSKSIQPYSPRRPGTVKKSARQHQVHAPVGRRIIGVAKAVGRNTRAKVDPARVRAPHVARGINTNRSRYRW